MTRMLLFNARRISDPAAVMECLLEDAGIVGDSYESRFLLGDVVVTNRVSRVSLNHVSIVSQARETLDMAFLTQHDVDVSTMEFP